jgi:hypothetical protein
MKAVRKIAGASLDVLSPVTDHVFVSWWVVPKEDIALDASGQRPEHLVGDQTITLHSKHTSRLRWETSSVLGLMSKCTR